MPLIDFEFLPQIASFIFVFAVVFGILEAASIFPKKKGINAAIAAVFAIFAVSYEPFVTALTNYIPIAAALLLIVFFIILLKKIFDQKQGQTFDAFPLTLTLGLLLLLIGFFWDDIGIVIPGFDSNNVLWLIGIVFIIIIFWAAYKHSPPQ